MKKMLLALLAVGLVGCGQSTEPITPVETPTETTQKTKEKAAPIADNSTKKKVVIEEYFDFNCGYCSRAAKVMKSLRAHYGDQLEFSLHHMNIYPVATELHRAAACAGEQDQLLAFHDAYFFQHYGRPEQKTIDKISADLGLNPDEMKSCLASNRPDNTMRTDKTRAQQFGARGTPFFLINGSLPIPGFLPEDSFKNELDKLLK